MHLNDKNIKVFARRMDECLRLAAKLNVRRGVERPLKKYSICELFCIKKRY